MSLSKLPIGIGLALAAILALLSGAGPVQAATTGGYPTALVEYMASTRTEPFFTA